MATATKNNILILGAGELGLSILHGLLNHHSSRSPTQEISVLVRQTTSTTNLETLPITIIKHDIISLSLSTLTEIFKPYTLIICALGFASGPGVQVKITKAILEAGVAKYVPWQFGVDYDVVGRGGVQEVWDEQLDVRELLRNQKGMEWVIVSTGMFMSFLFERMFGVVDVDADEDGSGEGDGKGVVRALGSWGNEVTVTTASDIGMLTAAIVFAEGDEKVANEVVYVAGETVSYSRVAWIIDNVLERRLRREVWDVEFLKEDLKKDPENNIKKYRVVFAEGRGVAWEMSRAWNKKNGIKVTDVEAFVRAKFGKPTVEEVVS